MRVVSRTIVAAAIAAEILACAQGTRPRTQAPAAIAVSPEPFADEIAAFEAADRRSPPQPGGVLFVGSSSIRMWSSLQSDFPGVNVIGRGFGGSEMSDVVRYARRIVIPYRPRLIVLYAGDNDLAVGKSGETVFDEYRAFVTLVHRALPDTRIAFVSIKPSGSRVALMGEMRKTNELVRQYVATDSHLLYVDVFTPMVAVDGNPREDLFLEDRLHMNAKGYAIWRDVLAPIVQQTASRSGASRQ